MVFRTVTRSMPVAFAVATGLLMAGCAGTAAPKAPEAPKAAAPAAATAVPKAVVPSPSPSPSPNPVTTTSDVIPAPTGVSVKITAPTQGAAVTAGNVRVAYDIGGVSLVPAADARRVEDLHIHVLLDVDPAPYLGTSLFLPLGNPSIVHTAAREVTFNNVGPGEHRVTIVLTGANHISVRPPATDSVAFRVQ